MNSAHKPVLIVVAGPNGSGKTTITSAVLENVWRENSVYINPDDVAQERFGDWNNAEAVLEAAKYCDMWREECLANAQSMIFETVMSTCSKVDFIRRAKEAGFFIRVFYVCTSSPTINVLRITQRVMNGGHDVPISKIISRYYRSIENLQAVSQIADRTYIYDNSIDDHEARLLFRMSVGRIVKRYAGELPDWARVITDNVQ